MKCVKYCGFCRENRVHNPLCIECGQIADTNVAVAYRDQAEIESNTPHAIMQAKRRRGHLNARKGRAQ